jgi:sigma-B regulation protein RsbU (phosphoserine phosphatase)
MAFIELRSLAAKLTILVMVGSSLILALILTYSYLSSRGIILGEATDGARNLALSTARNMQAELRAIEENTDKLATFFTYVHVDDKTLRDLIRINVEVEPEIFGSTAAFEPFAFDPKIQWYAPYYFREGKTVQYADLATASYHYYTKEWYTIPKALKTAVWSAPYFDEGGGNVIMTTYSAPFFKKPGKKEDKEVAGIVTADLSVDWLTKHLSSVKVGETGYCFLISDSGVFLAHPDKNLIMKESIFSVAERPGLARLKDVGRAMLSEQSGFLDLGKGVRGRESFLGFARLPSNGWSLGVVFPKDELFADTKRLYEYTAIIAVAGVALLLVMSLVVARSIAAPLKRMAQVTGRVAAGELDLKVPDTERKDEVGSLAKAFSQMNVDLKRYIKELTETTAEKQKMESELSIAAQIQRSLLPKGFSTLSGPGKPEIYAVMEPARHVGGDFYDFFPIGDNLIYFAIGDVCGKGIPAALLMARTKSLLESSVSDSITPNALLGRVNDILAENNDRYVFVTLFLGILEVNTGRLTFGNAGHEPPLVLRADDGVSFLGGGNGPALGLFPQEEYPFGEIILNPGDVLFTFTDGVTEALDVEGNLFSKERLFEEVNRLKGQSAQGLVDGVFEAVRTFSTGAVQADDITMFTFQMGTYKDDWQPIT